VLEEPKLTTSLSIDDDNDDTEDVHTWVQAQGVNLIPDDNVNANSAAPPADLDEEEDGNGTDDAYEDGTAIVQQPMPTTQNKTL